MSANFRRYLNMSKINHFLPIVLIGFSVFYAGCASRQLMYDEHAASLADDPDAWMFEDDAGVPPAPDPFEGLNRVVHGFNDIIITGLLKPVAKGYDAVMPDPAQTGISNFFDNVRFPVRWVSATAQGKHDRAGKELRKFALNSTVGILGFWKPSDKKEELRDVPSEDLGQALGHHGVGSGPYLVAPIIGGTNLRDLVGFIGGGFLNPFSYLYDWEYRLAVRAVENVNESPQLVEIYEEVKQATVDPYTAIKEGYHERREAAIDQ